MVHYNYVENKIIEKIIRKLIGCTYRLFKRDEFRQSVFGMKETFARSIRRISSAGHPSNDGSSLKPLASDNTLDWKQRDRVEEKRKKTYSIWHELFQIWLLCKVAIVGYSCLVAWLILKKYKFNFIIQAFDFENWLPIFYEFKNEMRHLTISMLKM